MVVKVHVVDDSVVVRQALQHMLAGQPDIELIGSAPNPLIAMPAIQKNRPDVLLLDIEMPGMDGLTFYARSWRARRSPPSSARPCRPKAARSRWMRWRPVPWPSWANPGWACGNFWMARAAR